MSEPNPRISQSTESGDPALPLSGVSATVTPSGAEEGRSGARGCPFCGCRPIVYVQDDTHEPVRRMMRCRACGLGYVEAETWNRRPEEDRLHAQIRELVDALKDAREHIDRDAIARFRIDRILRKHGETP